MIGTSRVTVTTIFMVLLLAGPMPWPGGIVSATFPHQCAGAAMEQAKTLLEFHFGLDDRMEIAPSVKVLPSIRNPADKAQRFDVLEVWGYVYKGQYRMRFLYAQRPNECLLMGQEILEFSRL